PVESERPAGREVEGCDMESLRTVRCLSNPSGLQAARWRDATWSPCGLSGACRIRAACRPRGGVLLAQDLAHHFPRGGHGQAVHELDHTRVFVRGHLAAD